MTNLGFGNTCDSSNSKTDEQIEQTKSKWKDWHENEYFEWLKEINR